MNSAESYFEDLLMRVIEGCASEEEFVTFSEIIRLDSELRRRYVREMRLHALLSCQGEEKSTGKLCLKLENPKRVSVQMNSGYRGTEAARRRKFSRWWKMAAAAAIVLAGMCVWRAVDTGRDEMSNAERRTVKSWTGESSGSSVSCPVKMVEWKGAWGLEMPQELPGRVRLSKGEAKVRLPSGVELALLGPLELESDERGMDVRLERGRLVAWVPTRASGFTVRAPGLTAWDIGTVFSVAAETDGSSLFVFKGSVQVLDGEGNGVDICEAGEGVRAMGDRTPFKVTAEGTTARRVFRAVSGYAAITEPRKAFDAVRQIGELWMAKYVPEEASRVQEKAERQAALRNVPKQVPFTKTAWVRPSVPRQKEVTSDMNTRNAAAVLAAATMVLGAGTAGAVSEPVPVDVSPRYDNGWWTTAFTNEIMLVWDREDAAQNVELKIAGMNRVFVTNFTHDVSNYLWRAFSSDVPDDEDVYNLTLTFYDSGNAVICAQTSCLAVVTGAFGETQVDPGPTETAAWRKVKENVVIPYDAGWAAATADATNSRLVIAKQGGITQTNTSAETAGYFGWKIKRSDWGYGTFNLALTFPGTEGEWDGTLVRVPDGMMIKVR